MKNLILLFVLLVISFSSHAGVDIQHWQTQSGSDVYFVENHDLPILDLSISFHAGRARDPIGKAGLASVTRHLMSLGAAGMNEEQITNAFADIGAQTSGSTNIDSASFTLRTLKSEHQKALTVFNKILHHPDFPKDVLLREKNRIIASLEEAKTQPDSLASKAFMKALYGEHPYGQVGEIETVNAIEHADLQAFYQQFFTANGAVIAMIGDVTKSEAEQIAETMSRGLPVGPAIKPISPVALPKKSIDVLIPHPASQAHVLMGYPGVKRGDPDYFPLYVGNYVLGGGGFVSRLMEEVREKRGLVYSVYSYFSPMEELGPFKIGFQTKKAQTAEALKVINETLKAFLDGGVTEEELKAAKSNITGGFPMRLDSNRKILGYIAMIGFYKLPLTYLEDFNQQVNNVTAAQIKEAFNRRVKPADFVSVVVGANESQ